MKYAQRRAWFANVEFLTSRTRLHFAVPHTPQQGYPSDETSIWKLRVERRKFETQPQLIRETRCSRCYLHMYLALSLALDQSMSEWMNAESESEACCGTREKHVCSSDAS